MPKKDVKKNSDNNNNDLKKPRKSFRKSIIKSVKNIKSTVSNIGKKYEDTNMYKKTSKRLENLVDFKKKVTNDYNKLMQDSKTELEYIDEFISNSGCDFSNKNFSDILKYKKFFSINNKFYGGFKYVKDKKFIRIDQELSNDSCKLYLKWGRESNDILEYTKLDKTINKTIDDLEKSYKTFDVGLNNLKNAMSKFLDSAFKQAKAFNEDKKSKIQIGTNGENKKIFIQNIKKELNKKEKLVESLWKRGVIDKSQKRSTSFEIGKQRKLISKIESENSRNDTEKIIKQFELSEMKAKKDLDDELKTTKQNKDKKSVNDIKLIQKEVNLDLDELLDIART